MVDVEQILVETTSGRLAVQVVGDAQAPPLLLLAGQANSHHWWDGIRDRLAEHRRTITFDYRGTGRTAELNPEDDGGWSTTSFAVDAVTVLEGLGCSSADVYGTSMGGRVAQELAINHPDRVRRLVLACTTPGGPHAVERSDAVRRALMTADRGKRLEAMINFFYTQDWPRDRRSNLFGDPTMTKRAAHRHLRVSAEHDAYDRLHRIAAETLILHGEDDPMAPVANAHLLADRIPHARLQLTPGGRHGFFDEFADDVNRAVLDFLGW